ncbi:MAG: alcohol dehydrogenase, class [Deferribacteraceae bacterium]|jgi:alcohol dehydrogenase class IV|nr:alcohol dehydrogenase, class [Deferribacteraceae bacterium]
MDKFYFYGPVKTFFKYEKDEIFTELLNDFNKVGVVSGKISIYKTGFKDFLIDTFKGKEFVFFDEVEENPSINTILKGGKFLRKDKCEIALGFGGGSSLDAAKAMACFANNDFGFYELLSKETVAPSLPLILVPTTCGTGSEVNNYSIITDKEAVDKINFSKESTFADYAVLLPEYLKFLNEEILISTVFDAFTHAFEGYISLRATPFSDFIAEEAMVNILQLLKDFYENNNFNYELALYSSTLAGFVILHTGTTLLHAFGYYLTNHKQIHHGKANAILLPKYFYMLKEEKVEKLQNIMRLIDKIDFDVLNFIDSFYKGADIGNILHKSELEKFVVYSIGKKNAAFTPINTDFDNIIRYFA